jgi:hypothetical protein
MNLRICGSKPERSKRSTAEFAFSLGDQRADANRQYGGLLKQREWKKASLKLLVLIPLLVVAFYFFRVRRGSMLAPNIYATAYVCEYPIRRGPLR